MAKKIGSDRSRDRDLNTDLDMEEKDDIFLEDPFGDAGGVDDNGGRSPAKATRKNITATAKGIAEGTLSALSEELERKMPNVVTVKTELSESYQDLKDLKDEIAKELQPMMLSMENTTRKILPRVSKIMPKTWYNKLQKTLDERAAMRQSGGTRSRDQERADLITQELSQVFEQQAKLAEHNEFESKKKEIFDRAISSTQHKAMQHSMARLYDSLRSTEIFHRTLHTAYMRKSLELQYKHLFVVQDTHNLLSKSLASFEDYFKGIVKNTGLPDVMKTQASDYIKQARTQKYGTMMADYLMNARKMIFQKLKSTVKDFMSNANFAAGGMDMMADSLNMADEMASMGGPTTGQMLRRQLGAWGGKLIAAGPMRALFDKLSPYTTAANGELENIKTRAYMGIGKLRKDWSGKGPLKAFLASFLPSMGAPATASNDLMTHGEDAAAFDKMTRASIVEVIPGYLGKILHSVDLIRDPKAQEKTFNFYKRDFTTVKEFRSDIFTDSRMFGNQAQQAKAIGEALATMSIGNERHGDTHGEEALENIKNLKPSLSRFISNHGVNHEHFDAQALVEFQKDPQTHWNDPYIKMCSTGINQRDFLPLVDAIVRGLTDKDGQLNKGLVSRFENAIHDIRQSTDGMVENLPRLAEGMGAYRFLRNKAGQKGLINDDLSLNKQLRGGLMSQFDHGDVDTWRKFSKGRQKEYLDARDLVAQRFSDAKTRFRNSTVGGYVVDRVNQTRAAFARGRSEWDKYELGPTEEGVTITEASNETSRMFEGILKAAPAVAAENEKDHKAVDDLIKEANRRFSEIDSSPISDVMKIEEKAKVKKELTSKYSAIIGKLESASKHKLVNRTLSAIMAAAGFDQKTIDSVPKNGKESKKAFRDIKTALFKWGDKQLDKLPQSPEDCQKLADKVSALFADDPNNKNLKQMMRDLRDRFLKHPEVKHIGEQIDKTLDYLNDTRIVKSGKAIGKYVGQEAQPYVDRVVAFSVDEYKKAKAFADPYINSALAGAGLDPKVVRKAAKGDADAQQKVWSCIRAMSADKRDKIMERLSKDNLAKTWVDVKATTASMASEAKEQIVKSPETIGSALGKATKKVRGVAETIRESYAAEAGGTPPPDTPEGSKEASPEESSDLLGLVKAFHQSTSAEHQGIYSALELAIQQLSKGIPVSTQTIGKDGKEVPGRGGVSDKEVSNALAVIRRRYGMFGRGGYLVGKAFQGVGKSALWTVKKAAGLYATTYKKAIEVGGNALNSLIGGVSRIGGWMANTAGLNPFVDIYVKGQEDKRPILTWRKQAHSPGVVYGVKKKGMWTPGTERVANSSDIPKKGVPIFDPKSGNMIITEEDLAKGLWAASGPLSQIGRAATALIRGTTGIYGTALKAIGAVGKIAAEGIFGKAAEKQEKYVDIYRKDEVDGKPLVTRRQQKKPGIFFVKSGERVERSSDITEPVMDKKKQILITEDDIEHGLVDVNNHKLGTSSGGKEGLLGKAFDIGGTIAKGIFGKTGLKIAGTVVSGAMAMYKGLFGALLGGGKAVGRGIANIGARIFGFDTPNGFGRKAFDGLNNRLDKLIALVGQIVAKGVGSGGGTVGGVSGKGEPVDLESVPETDRGRRGYWGKDGKFHPKKNGSSYENDGPDHPGGAAKSKANASGKVETKDGYVATSWKTEGGEGGEGEEEGSLLDTALDVAEWMPGKWGRKVRRALKKPRQWKKALKAKKARALRNAKKAFKSGKGLKGAARAAKEGWKGTAKAAKTARKVKKAAKVAKTARKASRAARVAGRAGKLGRIARLARFARLGKVGAALGATGGFLGKAGGALSRGAGRALGAVGLKGAAKFLGPAASIGLAAYDAYDGWNNAGQRLGKAESEVTTADRAGVATSGVMNGMSLGLANYIGDKIYGEGAVDEAYATIFNDPGGAVKATAKSVWNAINPWSADNQAEEEAEKKSADVNKKAKDQGKKIEAAIKSNLTGTDIGGFGSANISRLFQNFRKARNIDKARLSESFEKYHGWYNDPELVKEFCNWLKDTYPPSSDDPQGRLKYFRKMYNDPKRDETKKDILRIFGISNPRLKANWDAKLKELENAAEGKPGEAPKDTVSKAVDDAAKSIGGFGPAGVTAAMNGETAAIKGDGVPDDPVKKFEAFKKMYTDKDRATKYDKGILQSYGIDFPEDASEWDNAYKTLESEATAAKAADPNKYKDAYEQNNDPAKMLGKATSVKETALGKKETLADRKTKTAEGTTQFDFKKEISEAIASTGLKPEDVTKMGKQKFIELVSVKVRSTPIWKQVSDRERAAAVASLEQEADRLFSQAKSDPDAFMKTVNAGRWRGLKNEDGSWKGSDAQAWSRQSYVNGILVKDDRGGQYGNETEGWKWDMKDPSNITKMENGEQRTINRKDLSESELLELMHTYSSKAAKDSMLGGIRNHGRDMALAELKSRLEPTVHEYIKSIGGEEAVKQMTPAEFQKGLKEFAQKKGVFDRVPKDAPYQVKNVYQSHMSRIARRIYNEIVPDQGAGEMSDISKDLLLGPSKIVEEAQMRWGQEEFAKIKPPLDTTSLTPPKTDKDIVSANEAALASGMMQRNQTAKVTAALKSGKSEAPLTQQQMQELLKSTQQALMGYSKFSESFMKMCDKDGLKVQGIPELTAITAAKPAGSNTTIVNNVAAPADQGLDLHKKQL